jgi:hypothetical protein
MQNMRVKTPADKWETRKSRHGSMQAFMRQTESPSGILSQDIQNQALASVGNTLEFSVFDFNSGISIGNTREAIIVDAENTSRMVAVTFTDYSSGFTITPAAFKNNEESIQRDFENKFNALDIKMSESVNAAARAALESNKTKVFEQTLLYTELADVLVAQYAQKDNVLGDLNVIMAANDFYGELFVVANSGFESLVKNLRENRQFNSQNKDEQWNDKLWMWDNKLVNGEGKYATAFAIQEDSIGMLFQHERESLVRRRTADGHEWDMAVMPSGLPISTYYYESVADYSGIAGDATADMTRAYKEHYGFAIGVGYVTAYISDTANRSTPIMKVQINLAATDADSTAPTFTFTSSADLTNVVITSSEVLCTDQVGTSAAGEDIADKFTLTVATPGASITSATVDATGKIVTFVIDTTNLAAGDDIAVNADSLYDGAGNAVAAASIVDVNVGETAWEAV